MRAAASKWLQSGEGSAGTDLTTVYETRGTPVEKRDKAASKLTPTQIAHAQQLAREWKPIGIAYGQAPTVHPDYAEAVRELLMEDPRRIADAQSKFADVCANRLPQDLVEVARWAQWAAVQGLANAQNDLGVMYAEGRGVPQDYIFAPMWFNLAASRYAELEREKRESAVKNRDTLESTMTPAQVAEAQRMARKWKPKKEK